MHWQRRRSRSPSRDENISRALVYLLRHSNDERRLGMRSDGYCPLRDVLRRRRLQILGACEKDVLRIIRASGKPRLQRTSIGAASTFVACKGIPPVRLLLMNEFTR